MTRTSQRLLTARACGRGGDGGQSGQSSGIAVSGLTGPLRRTLANPDYPVHFLSRIQRCARGEAVRPRGASVRAWPPSDIRSSPGSSIASARPWSRGRPVPRGDARRAGRPRAGGRRRQRAELRPLSGDASTRWWRSSPSPTCAKGRRRPRARRRRRNRARRRRPPAPGGGRQLRRRCGQPGARARCPTPTTRSPSCAACCARVARCASSSTCARAARARRACRRRWTAPACGRGFDRRLPHRPRHSGRARARGLHARTRPARRRRPRGQSRQPARRRRGGGAVERRDERGGPAGGEREDARRRRRRRRHRRLRALLPGARGGGDRDAARGRHRAGRRPPARGRPARSARRRQGRAGQDGDDQAQRRPGHEHGHDAAPSRCSRSRTA